MATTLQGNLRELRAIRRDETFAAALATNERLAAESFEDHALQALGPGRWKCQRPGSWCYGFYVLISPGAVVFYGDLDDVVLRMNEGSDAAILAWLRGAVNSRDYLLSKLKSEHRRDFYLGDALAWAQEQRPYRRSGPDPVRSFREQLAEEAASYTTIDQRRFHEIAIDHGIDDVGSVGEGWASGALWVWQGLRVFMRLHDAQMAPQAEEARS